MRYHRKANERFHSKFGWLDSWHTFSFGQHYDPEHMGFRALRVINDDVIAGGAGFPTHPHSDMEILSVMAEGHLAHKDSEGNGSSIGVNDVQLMSAGKGIQHSEFNPSPSEQARLLQIWIIPDKRGYPPRYQETAIDPAKLQGQFGLLVSPDGAAGSLAIRQDAKVFRGNFTAGQKRDLDLDAKRFYWLQVIAGEVAADGLKLVRGDGLAIAEETALKLDFGSDSDVLFFDLN